MSEVFEKKTLEGKTAVVTGGGSGINLSIAKRFAEHGARVALIGRTKDKLDAAAAEISATGGTASGHPADVRDYDALAGAIKSARDAHGEIDLVVCGAAGNFPAPALGMSANAFKSVVDIDLLGTFNTCRAVFEFLKRPGASIINISAMQAFTPMPMQAHVCAAKAGVDMLTKCLAIEWGPEGVRVNSIAPGAVDDTEGMRRLAPTPEIRNQFTRTVPLQRFATKDEIANLALFLSSDAARFITGAIVVCDGGQSLAGLGVNMMAAMRPRA
ncbi:MAG TPA: SDR family oxidoreductase [Gemmatimonadaceae bacterium]|jgi:NAD(P)-dependent dehydrogenase (short-subunit alcohol dehydrogenase family)|nr:SDR family oxidoreductase [Gemmatimonadaceae bacterium]